MSKGNLEFLNEQPRISDDEFIRRFHQKALLHEKKRKEAEEAERKAQESESSQKEEQEKAKSYSVFPAEVLPKPVCTFIEEGALAIGCDASFIALPLLSALASAIGNTRRIELKKGWTEPAIIWTAIVGESGTAKSPAFRLVTEILHKRQAQALRQHAEDMKVFDSVLLQYEKELALWKRNKSDKGEAPEKPEAPQANRLVVSDTTVEALAPLLLSNPKGLLLSTDELAGWVGSFDRYAGGKGGSDAAHWLSMFNAETIVVDRKTGHPRTIYVPQASMSVSGGIQPGTLRRMFGQEHRESGLAARLLLACPQRIAKTWRDDVIDPLVAEKMALVFDRLFDLPMTPNDEGIPQAQIMTLAPEAKIAWIDFYNRHAKEQCELTGDLAAVWSKLEGYAARFALVIHMVRLAAEDETLADADTVDEESVRSGIALSNWFGQEAKRAYAIINESVTESEQRQLVEQIRNLGGFVSVRDWQRIRSMETSEQAKAELELLVKADLGNMDKKMSPSAKGGRPSQGFLLAKISG